ncbi:hypothetical protein KSP40_PGU013879 [Platanthera guangdongensis]|uniref:RNase H type-1 domain-containing protein n=1 Tax=Platanthera guangdongensis TaxID=2320717 RepID=A0ABR2LEA4_9ASPA
MDNCAVGLRRGDWSVTVDGEEDFSFLSGFPQLRFQHIGREANRAAVFCARFAIRGNFVWLDVESTHSEFAELVRADLDDML